MSDDKLEMALRLLNQAMKAQNVRLDILEELVLSLMKDVRELREQLSDTQS